VVELDKNRTDDLSSDDRSAPHLLQYNPPPHVSPVPQYLDVVRFCQAQLPEALVLYLLGVRAEAQETGDR